MSRASTIYRDRIEYGLQLIVDDQGGVRMTRVPGKLASNERAIDVSVTMPRVVFQRPTLRAEINVAPVELSIPPIKIEALQTVLRDAFGANVLVTVQSQEHPE